jgi:hypothetical protein
MVGEWGKRATHLWRKMTAHFRWVHHAGGSFDHIRRRRRVIELDARNPKLVGHLFDGHGAGFAAVGFGGGVSLGDLVVQRTLENVGKRR